jgi:ribosomal protein S18 acetylase RimI-like enzyme
MSVTIRSAEPADHARVASVIDGWWGGRRMREMLPRLFFVHFRETTFVAEEGEELVGFLCAFASQTYLDEMYCHFVGVHPVHRRTGLATALYERLFAAAREHGRTVVSCVTSPENTASIDFHRELGFEVVGEIADYDGAGEPRVLLRKRL